MKKFLVVVLILVVVGLVAVFVTPVTARNNNVTTADVFEFDPFPVPGEQVEGGWAQLKTNDQGATLHLKTAELEPGTAVTIWWVIFNQPENCEGYPDGSCGLIDLENPDVVPEITYATGAVIGSNGKANFQADLAVGHTAQEWFGNGFTNPTGAEIHTIVHSHGQVIPELKDNMTSTFRGGCGDDEMIVPGHPAYNDGIPGPNQCEDLQFSVLQQ
jgi:hypothetical protein